ncbi:CHASE3 domain-containing protein [Sphingosinicellaceae bacterium]|nr:CHASE3 domain-containing protein [Sphingosinicellaceae bacterium]
MDGAPLIEVNAEAPATYSRISWVLALVAAAGFALLLGGLVQSSLRANAARDNAAAWQLHTYQVMLTAERLQSAVFDAQRSRRGYVINDGRDLALLIPYRAAVAKVPGLIRELRRLTADSPDQQQRITTLDALIAPQLRRMADLSTATRQKATVGNDGSTSAGEVNINQIRAAVARIVDTEQGLLRARNDRVREADAEVKAASRSLSFSGLALLVIALVTGSFAVNALLRARRAAQDAAEAVQARIALEVAVNARTAEIAASNTALRQEIAAKQAAEAQIRQMQKLESIGQLTGGIAHDFNNMLSIIIGSLDLAVRRLNEPDGRVRKYIDNATDGAKRAAALTARLLAFSRQQALAPEPIDANVFVGNISELLRRTLGEGIKIETVLAGGLWRTYADAGELENAVVNLAVNARDAMEGSGRLTIETANTHLDDAYARDHADVTPGQYVVVCVTDTGGGMPAEVIEKAFDPFFTTKSVGKGTGLGLSQVYGFVKQSGGHVKIYSEAGKGTTVKLYMPRWTGADATPRELLPTAAMPVAVDGEIIVVVEDEERVRLVTVDALRDLGYQVVHAGDGREALTLLATMDRVDLLFTDIVMPNMNGRELADAARFHREGIKVLYTTGYTRNAVVHNGMLDADVAFLPKPFTVQALALKVRQVLDGGGVNRRV